MKKCEYCGEIYDSEVTEMTDFIDCEGLCQDCIDYFVADKIEVLETEETLIRGLN